MQAAHGMTASAVSSVVPVQNIDRAGANRGGPLSERLALKSAWSPPVARTFCSAEPVGIQASAIQIVETLRTGDYGIRPIRGLSSFRTDGLNTGPPANNNGTLNQRHD